MLRQRGLPKDKVLFRLLKNKSPAAGDICEKLNNNVKNIALLSEDELCELWQHMKSILLEAQKLYRQTSCDNDKHAKECSHMVKLIRMITATALETIVQRIFIPNILLQNIMLLHSVILPNIKDEQARNEISHLLENWWKLDLTWKEKVIINTLKYLIQCCRSSMQHVKRLYEIRTAITLLRNTEDVQELLKLVREENVILHEEGQMLMLHLFTLGEQYILGIHNNVRVVLQDVEKSHITAYADLYATAWLKASQNLKKFIVDNCFQNIVFHCFRAHRDTSGRGKLGNNLLSFLAAMHNNKYQAVRLMIHNQCKPLLWMHLKTAGTLVKCNAVEILFITSSVQYTCGAKDRNKIFLQKYYKTISDLLQDTDLEVCDVTMKGLFNVLEKYWNCIPSNIIRDWLNILLRHTKNASNSRIRAAVFVGLRKILVKQRSHKMLKDFLPNFASSIYDDDETVLEALVQLLWHVQDQLEMPFWEIVPFAYILDRLGTTDNMFLLQKLIKLVWTRLSSCGDYDEIKAEIARMGLSNVNAIRRFCLHSKDIIKWDVSTKLIEVMLSTIKEEMECVPVRKVLKRNCNKRMKLGSVENKLDDNDYTNIDDEEFIDHRDVQIYIDVIAMLLVANVKHIGEENFYAPDVNILQAIANALPEFFKCFKDTPVNDSVIFLFSLVPPQFFLDKMEPIEMLVQKLCDPNVPDDTLVTVVYVLMKWEKGDTILYALTNLFTESLSTSVQDSQDTNGNTEVFQVNEKGLKLSLRILKHLLHGEYQSILMNKYHRDVLKFWDHLHKLKTFIEKESNNVYNIDSPISKDVIIQFFQEYISMISLLHKKDVFDALKHFSEILLWVKRVLIPHVSRLDLSATDNHNTFVDLIQCTLDASNVLLKEYSCTPKLCCDIVLLYCSCLSPANGIIFFNNAADAIMAILDYGKIAFEKQERNLLNIVVPNFLCVTMVNLTRHSKELLAQYTNGLKVLNALTQKYFFIMKNTFNDPSSYLPYINIMFTTAISNISMEVTRVLQCCNITRETILIAKFPYLARKILRILLNTKKYQKLCLQELSKTITSYTKIDMLSALIVMQKMLKSTDKTVINRIKNLTLATNVYNRKQSCDTPFDRSINDAMNIVIDEILKQ